ncbi:MAG: GerMN domain-containing protein [Candidatus Krumholzibacteriia bacterium]
MTDSSTNGPDGQGLDSDKRWLGDDPGGNRSGDAGVGAHGFGGRKKWSAGDALVEAASRRGRLLFWTLLVVLVGAACWILFWPHAGLAPESEPVPIERRPAAVGVRPVVLYFADREARSLVTERRDVPFAETLEERVEATLHALLQGPDQQGGVPVLPRNARVTQAFYDDETATLYLDFNAALVTQHPGGSTAEYYTIGALVRTVAANFPQVVSLQILVDGQPIDSLAGHFDTSKPIDIASWQ